MEKTRIWLVRHAQTQAPHLFHGYESDIDLSELGKRQAQHLAPVLASYQPDFIFSSGMKRAMQTATPVAQLCQLPLHIELALHERKLGSLAGTPTQLELGIAPDTLRHWQEGDLHYATHGSESLYQLRLRLTPAWEKITSVSKGRSAVVICHGIVCRVLLMTMVQGLSLADWTRIGPIANTSISELEGNGSDWHARLIAKVPPEIPR